MNAKKIRDIVPGTVFVSSDGERLDMVIGVQLRDDVGYIGVSKLNIFRIYLNGGPPEMFKVSGWLDSTPYEDWVEL